MKLAVVTLIIALTVAACSSRVENSRIEPAPAQNPININTASIDELESLPYIGRTTAELIVEFRKRNGPFRRPEQIMLIRGVSESRFLEIRDRLEAR